MTVQQDEDADNETIAVTPAPTAHLLPAELSIVIPTRNESRNVEPMIAGLARALGAIRWEAIFVDDDSPGPLLS